MANSSSQVMDEEWQCCAKGDQCVKCEGCEEHIVQVERPTEPPPPTRSTSETVRQSGLRYTNSLDSATQWRKTLRRRPVCRCLSSAMTMVSISMGVLVLGSIIGIRFLSWGIISDSLTVTSEEGQKSQVDQVSKEVLAFFQIGSRMAQATSQFYDIAFERDNQSAPQKFFSGFGKTQWSSLRQSVTGQDVMVTQARNPDLISSVDPNCNMDGVLIGDRYIYNTNPQTSGLSEEQVNASRAAGNFLASTGVRLAVIAGESFLPNPFMPVSEVSDPPCLQAGGANGAKMWDDYQLPGSWGDSAANSYSGLEAPMWQRKTLVDGRYDLVRKSVLFNLPGPEWAPKSAWGRVTIRVADDQGTFGSVNLQSMLRSVSASSRDNPVIFVLTRQGELLATSVEGQKIIKEIDGQGATGAQAAGLIRGDREGAVVQPIQPVAKVLIDRHCSTDASGELDCDWEDVEAGEVQYIGNYAVVAKPIEDPLAAGLGMLLVDLVDSEAITGRIDEINLTLFYLGLPIMGAAILLFIILSRQVTVPLRKARDNMFLLSDMKIDDAVAAYADTGCCNRPLFTEAGDLRLSFLHASSALKNWRLKEIERRTLLEEERAQRIQHTVEKAVQGAGKLMHPMVLISAEEFMQMKELTSYELLRNDGKLEFLDTEDDLAKFKTGHSIIFLSHQWLGWGFPDDEQQTQLKAMKSAVRTAAQQMRATGARGAWKNTFVWVDYCSIAQEHRGMQTLAVSSLPVYASSADVFIIVAPPAKHVQSNNHADLHSYNSRGWCRAEMLSKICSSGLENFFVLSTEGGELQRVTEEWLPSLSMYVFEGEFSCCQQGHHNGACDKEALIEPVLGLYSLVLRQVNGAAGGNGARHMEQVLRHINQSKERFFPKKYTYKVVTPEGSTREERELFGPLVEALEVHMSKESGVWRSDSMGSVASARSKVFWVF